MRLWSTKSLDERCVLFQRKFPSITLTRDKLRELYRKLRIRKKKIRRTKIVTPRKKRQIMQQALEALKLLTRLKFSGWSIIYVDELTFSLKTQLTHAYSLPNAPLEIDLNQFKGKCVAVEVAMSYHRGIELVRMYPKSVTIAKFKTFLEELR